MGYTTASVMMFGGSVSDAERILVGFNSNVLCGTNSIALMGSNLYYSEKAVSLTGSSIEDYSDFSLAVGGSTIGYASTGSFAVSQSEAHAPYVFAGSQGVGLAYQSVALGNGVRGTSEWSVNLGRFNRGVSFSRNANLYYYFSNLPVWIELESLFELGNGTSSAAKSNAITVLKNGKTTLTNKYWSPETPTIVPSQDAELTVSYDGNTPVRETLDISSGGIALEVEGHALIRGNATIRGRLTMEQPQGDILMGVFGEQAQDDE